ncbi:MAG: hypothetical protein IPI65_07865 [Bacteroidetes bacterium]|nr:hypothetical protein [Bacteroidota bacterium]
MEFCKFEYQNYIEPIFKVLILDMFWNKKNIKPIGESVETNGSGKVEHFPFIERRCWLFISSKFKEILFVPVGKDKISFNELDSIIIKQWPLKIEELQDCIQLTLDKFVQNVEDQPPTNENWYSLKNSKAKTQQSFKIEYVQIELKTDMEKEYGPKEVERILINAGPFDNLKTRYKLIGKSHLIDTEVAEVVVEIFNACEKIRTD